MPVAHADATPAFLAIRAPSEFEVPFALKITSKMEVNADVMPGSCAPDAIREINHSLQYRASSDVPLRLHGLGSGGWPNVSAVVHQVREEPGEEAPSGPGSAVGAPASARPTRSASGRESANRGFAPADIQTIK